MVDTGTAIIVSGIISLMGMIVWSERNHIFWFKKENYKAKRKLEDAENKLKLKKLERELGLSKITPSKEIPAETSNPLLALAPIVKQMSPDQLKGLAEMFLGGDIAEEIGEGGIGEVLLEQAEQHPELAKAVLDKVLPVITKNNINAQSDTY